MTFPAFTELLTLNANSVLLQCVEEDLIKGDLTFAARVALMMGMPGYDHLKVGVVVRCGLKVPVLEVGMLVIYLPSTSVCILRNHEKYRITSHRDIRCQLALRYLHPPKVKA